MTSVNQYPLLGDTCEEGSTIRVPGGYNLDAWTRRVNKRKYKILSSKMRRGDSESVIQKLAVKSTRYPLKYAAKIP